MSHLHVYIPVRCRTGAALVHSATNRFSQVTREGGVGKQEASVRARPIEVRVIQLLL